MRNKKGKVFFVVLAALVGAGVLAAQTKEKQPSAGKSKEIAPVTGSIENFISCTGTVLPKNRLEIKPPVNGRIEKILVKEGDHVNAGQVLAMMSSTERAALLDAARGKGGAALKYWEEAYKPIPLSAPIEAEVIVAKTQPGQTVTTADAVLVLSDQLIIRAQVDETDIGKITADKKAYVTLDAYPENRIKAGIDHIYYESKTVNNVTIYEVDLIPESVPDFFRSGMNATIDFVEKGSDSALLIPVAAVIKEKGKDYVLLKNNGDQPQRREVALGLTDEKNIEVLSGITADDRIVVSDKKFNLPASTRGKSPFFPGH